jgi:hypothetical protein
MSMQPPDGVPPSQIPEDDRLQPMPASDIVGRAVGLWWRNLWAIAGLVAVVAVPTQVIMVLFFTQAVSDLPPAPFAPGETPTQAEMEAFLQSYLAVMPTLGIGLLAAGAGYFIQQAVLVPAAADIHFGSPASIGSAYRRALARVGPLIGANLLLFLTALGAVMIIFGVLVAAVGLGEEAGGSLALLGVLGMLAAVPAAIYAGVRVSFFSQYIILGNHGPWVSMAASWRLVHGTWWRVLGVILLLVIVNIILSIPINIVSAIVTQPAAVDPFANAPLIVVTGVLGAILSAIVMIGSVILYYDLRVRKGEVFPAPAERQA